MTPGAGARRLPPGPTIGKATIVSSLQLSNQHLSPERSAARFFRCPRACPEGAHLGVPGMPPTGRDGRCENSRPCHSASVLARENAEKVPVFGWLS
jgi:hypothetical protein